MRRIFLLLLLGAPLLTGAQQGFINTYDLDHTGVTFNNILLDQDNLIITGVVLNNNPPYNQGLFLARFDTTGQILNYQEYYDALNDDYVLRPHVHPLIKLSGGGFALLGVLFARRNGVLIVTDNAGSVILVKEYSDSTSITDYYEEIVVLENGFMIAGQKQKIDLSKVEFFVMRTDFEGEKIWEKKYSIPGKNQVAVGSFIQTKPNEFVLAGGVTHYEDNQPPEQINGNAILMGLDSVGEVLWTWISPEPLEDAGAGGLEKTSDNAWTYISGKLMVMPSSPSYTSYVVVQPILVRRDSNFNLIWNKVVGQPTSANNIFNDLKRVGPGQGYVAVGQLQTADEFQGDPPPYVLAGAMYRFSEDGDVLWSRLDTISMSFPWYNEHYLSASVVLPSGSIVACGYTYTQTQTLGWLIKVSPDGCVDTLHCAVSALLLPEPGAVAGALRVFPNPADHQAVFEWRLPPGVGEIQLEVWDSRGRLVESAFGLSRQGRYVWRTGYAPTGVYFYRLADIGGRILASGRVLVSR